MFSDINISEQGRFYGGGGRGAVPNEKCVPLLTGEGLGDRAVTPLQKKINFGSEIGEFWCKLGTVCTNSPIAFLGTHCFLGTLFPLSK